MFDMVGVDLELDRTAAVVAGGYSSEAAADCNSAEAAVAAVRSSSVAVDGASGIAAGHGMGCHIAVVAVRTGLAVVGSLRTADSEADRSSCSPCVDLAMYSTNEISKNERVPEAVEVEDRSNERDRGREEKILNLIFLLAWMLGSLEQIGDQIELK